MKKTSKVVPRTFQARVSNASLLESLAKLQSETGWTESDLIREALKEYVHRERMRDEIAAMDQRFGATVNRLIRMQQTMRSEMAVLVAFMHEFSGLYLFNTVEPPEDMRGVAAADAARRHKIFMRRVEKAYRGGNPLDELVEADEDESESESED